MPLQRKSPFLPLRPLWPGFALNTLIYAAILWLLIPGPFVLRRFLRVKRGLCPKCAYPMGESGVCTECGKALPHRRRMPKSDMKRRLLIIAVLLALGAVVNVAVAWGLVELVDWIDVIPLDRVREASAWPSPVPQHWPATASELSRELSGLDVHRYAARREDGDVVYRFAIDVYRVGWPCLSLQWELWRNWFAPKGEAPTYGNTIHLFSGLPEPTPWLSGVHLQRWTSEPWKTVPICPVWLGFAINTLFYATLLWLLIPGPFALRRLRRVRRGLCPKCAYPMGESAVCSECGGALAKHHVA